MRPKFSILNSPFSIKMINSLLIGIGGMVGLMVVWYIVQRLWGDSFSDYISDDDVLAARGGCGNCGCGTACEKKKFDIRNTGN